MYNIIPLILILLSLAIMTGIAVRKFSALASLDVESIPAEKENRSKERIISNRLKRNTTYITARFTRAAGVIGRKIAAFLAFIFSRLSSVQKKFREDKLTNQQGEVSEERMARLFNDAEAAIKKESFDEAEKIFIEIISLQSRNLKAFRRLGNLYILRKQYEEAKQTFEHVLKLLDDDEAEDVARRGENLDEELKALALERGQVYFELAGVFRGRKNYPKAIKNLKEAVKAEPLNPKYLDTLIETSIMAKDKITAMEAVGDLEKANPDNQKLKEFRDRIKEL